MARLFANLFGKTKTPAIKKSYRPEVDALEARWAPAVSVLRSADLHTITITGDAGNNNVQIIQNDTNNTFKVVADGVTHVFGQANKITDVHSQLKEGNDTFIYTVAGSAGFVNKKNIFSAMGQGNDTCFFNFFTTLKADLSIDARGGDGNDIISARFGTLQNAHVNYLADGLGGDDYMALIFNGDLLGTSSVVADVRGGTGNDTLFMRANDDFFHNHDGVDIAAGAKLAVTLEGNEDSDSIDAAYAGHVQGKLSLLAQGGDGADKIKESVTVFFASFGSVDALEDGGAGNDNLALNLQDNTRSFFHRNGTLAHRQATMDGGLGFDHGVVTGNAPVAKISVEF
jgi:hypothetical protein